jgi:class 3 adenylate cyclase/tetratricopeptide (TPR) repeat protein
MAPAACADANNRLLEPYVPTFVADWLQERPGDRYRAVDCTLVFADISGFTRMTEMLAGQGKAGAEEMASLINSTFRPLLDAAYQYGAGLIKWGGDATLLLFEGPDHARCACRAAADMQRVMRELGTRQTSRGPLRLRMSIGASSGTGDFFLLGSPEHRELLVLGPVATVLTQMEKVAEAGQIVISPRTVAELIRAGERPPTTPAGDGWLLRYAPRVAPVEASFAAREAGFVVRALSPILRDAILADALESEHRYVTAGFVKFTQTDRMIAESGPAAVADAVEHVIQVAQVAALENGVTFLGTDIGPDCGKLMLAAGAPARRGGDERRMAAALRTIVQAGGPLPISGGATAGRAFCGDYGPPYRRTYSLMGDCVNLAARLMAHAPDGEVLASRELVSALAGAFVTEPRPPFAAKGKSLPVHPFSLGPPAGGASTAGEESPLIGRQAELARLLEAAERAAAGAGMTIDLVGEPGMGKSRLLSELQARTSSTVVWTQGEVYAGTRPYAPFARFMRMVCGLPPEAPAQELTSRLTALADRDVPELVPWLPLVGIVAGLDLPTTLEVEQTDPALRKERLEEVTSELLGRLLRRPSALILNDVHLMDDASRDLIRRLVADASRRPWLVVTSRRPDSESPLGEVPATLLELGPLSDEAAAELLARATEDSPLTPERLIQLAERAEGNPLFLRELSAQLTEGGDVDTLPSSVEEAIAARIDRLDAPDRRVLRAAAVLGMDVDSPLLRKVLEPELDRLPSGVQMESLSEFLDPSGPERHRFAHQLIREVAYDALPYRRRTDLHARTADAIREAAGPDADRDAELLSLHCFHGEQFDDAWSYSLIAAQRATARYANVEAADSYRRALAAGHHVADLKATELAEVDEALGELCLNLGEPDVAEVAFRRGLRRVRGQPIATAQILLKMVWLREVNGKYRPAMQWARRAEQALEGLEDRESKVLRAKIAMWRARLGYRLGHLRDTLDYAENAIQLAQETDQLMTLADALELRDSSALELGRPAGDGVARALAIYEDLGASRHAARVRNTLGALAYYRGEWSEALDHYAASERGFTESGERWSSATPAANRAEILADQGHLEEAREGFERAMRVWRSIKGESFLAFGNYQLGRIAARQGQQDEAWDRLRAAREHFKSTGESAELIVVDAFMAESLCLAGHYDEALALAEATLRRAEAHAEVAATTPLLERVRGLALLAGGRETEAEAALRLGLDAARSRGAGHDIAFLLKTLLDAGFAGNTGEEADWRYELSVLVGALGLNLQVEVGSTAPSPSQ